LTNLARCYDELASQASSALDIESKLTTLPSPFKETSLYGQITNQLGTFRNSAASPIREAKRKYAEELSRLDENYIKPLSNPDELAYEVRWSFYRSTCLLANSKVDDQIIGRLGQSFSNLVVNAQNISGRLSTYQGPLAREVSTICFKTIGQDVETPKKQFVESYARHLGARLSQLKFPLRLNATDAYSGTELSALRKSILNGLETDLNNPALSSFAPAAQILAPLRASKLAAVANGLSAPDGTLGEMEIVFTAPVSATVEDRVALRYVKVMVDGKEIPLTGGTRPGDLSSFGKDPTVVAAKVPVGAKVQFEFFSNVDRTTQSAAYGEENWLLPRLIQKDNAQRQASRETEWQLKLPVTVKVGNKETSGTVEAFSIRLKNPLPKKDEWPK